MRASRLSVLVAGLCLAFAAHAADTDSWNLPVAVKKLDNGLTVVVSEDHSSPTVGISMVYHVGMRLEPQNRTGFAHLFEHLMFEGTPDAPKGVFDTRDPGRRRRITTAPPAPTSPTTSSPRRRPRWSRCCGWRPTA